MYINNFLYLFNNRDTNITTQGNGDEVHYFGILSSTVTKDGYSIS